MRGSCLCGGVQYEINGPLTGVINCHCSTCRKAHSAAFRTRAWVRKADFRWIAGEELLTFYASSPGNHRGFCGVCGSPMLSVLDDEAERFGIPLGPLDGDPGVRPRANIFVADKAPWFDITDGLPQYRGFPEDPT
jgi:hypothetical protein